MADLSLELLSREITAKHIISPHPPRKREESRRSDRSAKCSWSAARHELLAATFRDETLSIGNCSLQFLGSSIFLCTESHRLSVTDGALQHNCRDPLFCLPLLEIMHRILAPSGMAN